ncbi:MAG: DUF979 domain-containing protein, partial [Clostridium sp.]
MDIKEISKLLLEIFYVMLGGLMLTTSVITLKDKYHKTRFGSSLFWLILAVIFMFGAIIPAEIVGMMIIVIAGLTVSKQVNIGTIKALDSVFADEQSKKLGNKVFIPSVSIAVIALVIAQGLPKLGGTVAIGISATASIAITFYITKAKPKEFVEDGNRMLQSIGSTAILPQLLAALGALFTAAGVGEVISGIISNVVPEGNILFGVTAYCLGMAIFTMIMGNAYAAFAVITAGIGLPFVFMQGGNVVVASALALTAGYCGTLLTPMAANFNVMPAALLEMKDKNGIAKYQAPFAILLLLI